MKICIMRFWLPILLFSNFLAVAVPIDTPEVDERNEFVIKCPFGWGYRTFKGHNGLIGVLWPANTSFNLTDTAVFVFLQTAYEDIPDEADNINLFTEKCPLAQFKFAEEGTENDNTLSIEEKYFSGRCGRTMVLFKEVVGPYTLVFAYISANYVSKKQFFDVKQMVAAYKDEVQKYIERALKSDK